SMLFSPPATLIVARPRRMTPPQRPRSLSVRSNGSATSSSSAVKTMGACAVPLASIFAPRVTTRAAASSGLALNRPRTTVPGSMVSVQPSRTKTRPTRTYVLAAVQVCVQTSPETSTGACAAARPGARRASGVARSVRMAVGGVGYVDSGKGVWPRASVEAVGEADGEGAGAGVGARDVLDALVGVAEAGVAAEDVLGGGAEAEAAPEALAEREVER